MSSTTDQSSLEAETPVVCDAFSVEEHGRSFHGYKAGRYFLPNDHSEQYREERVHRFFLLVLKGRIGAAPISCKHGDVLDIGTGIGSWAIQFSNDNPGSEVIGTDLSLIQPDTYPPNCTFVREDVEEPWIFGKLFDYVHLRAMSMCFVRPRALVQAIYDNLKPGGWVEFQDYTLKSQPAHESLRDRVVNSACVQIENLIKKVLKIIPKYSRDLVEVEQWKEWMIEAGFVDVNVETVLCPMSPWSNDPRLKEIGRLGSETALSAMTAFGTLLSSGGWSEQEIEALQQGIIKEHQDPTFQSYVPVYFLYGRKPMD